MKGVAFLLVAVTLGGCATALSKVERGTPVDLTAMQRASVEKGVRDSLKDPASATFGTMAAAVDKTGAITVCGTVNARNSYGGYAGAQPYIGMFVVVPEKDKQSPVFVAQAVGGDDTARQVTTTVCARYGATVLPI